MIGLVLATAVAYGSPALARLEQLAEALDRSAEAAQRLEHGAAAAARDRRLLVDALVASDAAFDAVLALPGALAADDANDIAGALADAGRALREWDDARDAADRAWMRSAARHLREAIERAQAIVSAAETVAPNS